jgi:hypothetical protein
MCTNFRVQFLQPCIKRDLLRTETDPSKTQTIVMLLTEKGARPSTLSSGKINS